MSVSLSFFWNHRSHNTLDVNNDSVAIETITGLLSGWHQRWWYRRHMNTCLRYFLLFISCSFVCLNTFPWTPVWHHTRRTSEDTRHTAYWNQVSVSHRHGNSFCLSILSSQDACHHDNSKEKLCWSGLKFNTDLRAAVERNKRNVIGNLFDPVQRWTEPLFSLSIHPSVIYAADLSAASYRKCHKRDVKPDRTDV